ncbi:hypothetical protein NKH18_07190 [Streptomyces sp. M10(2022)]
MTGRNDGRATDQGASTRLPVTNTSPSTTITAPPGPARTRCGIRLSAEHRRS